MASDNLFQIIWYDSRELVGEADHDSECRNSDYITKLIRWNRQKLSYGDGQKSRESRFDLKFKSNFSSGAASKITVFSTSSSRHPERSVARDKAAELILIMQEKLSQVMARIREVESRIEYLKEITRSRRNINKLRRDSVDLRKFNSETGEEGGLCSKIFKDRLSDKVSPTGLFWFFWPVVVFWLLNKKSRVQEVK